MAEIIQTIVLLITSSLAHGGSSTGKSDEIKDIAVVYHNDGMMLFATLEHTRPSIVSAIIKFENNIPSVSNITACPHFDSPNFKGCWAKCHSRGCNDQCYRGMKLRSGDQDGICWNSKIASPMGLDADPSSNKVYFIDKGSSKIKSYDYQHGLIDHDDIIGLPSSIERLAICNTTRSMYITGGSNYGPIVIVADMRTKTTRLLHGKIDHDQDDKKKYHKTSAIGVNDEGDTIIACYAGDEVEIMTITEKSISGKKLKYHCHAVSYDSIDDQFILFSNSRLSTKKKRAGQYMFLKRNHDSKLYKTNRKAYTQVHGIHGSSRVLTLGNEKHFFLASTYEGTISHCVDFECSSLI